jgi:GTP cyclohydrolase I
MSVDVDDMQVAVQHLLFNLGYDMADPHFARTPERVVEYLSGFANNNGDPPRGILDVVFPAEAPDDMVIVGPVDYRSLCAHHLLPVVGEAWVGYLPDNAICGLSKLGRLVEYYASQLTVQERVTKQIADFVEDQLKPKGCMVVIRAAHLCMSFRGIRNGNAFTATSAVRGLHKDSAAARAEFLSLMGDPR